ncbi:hypothetical protein SLS60_007178 [Paraconiothyrium brasiliense]|uniref:Uncharacterized protein n=1 Tax=Paraconiothyrium brasiliense TaxID=300254 RepID=A0ABR3R8L8_9PLEO
MKDLSVNVHRVEDAITTQDRDAAMTRDSDYDILRYLTEEEAKKLYGEGWWPKVTNTELNERRREAIMSQKNVVGEGERGEEEEGVEGKGNVELVEGIVHGTRRRTRLGRLLRLRH